MRTKALFLVMILVLLSLPLFGFYPVMLMKILSYALFAIALNLLLGYTGLLSFGHAAFFGSAAYITGHSLTVWGVSTLSGILIGIFSSAILGVVIGYVSVRRSGIYFAMITLAMAQMIYFYFLQAPFTYGEDGLQGIPRGSIFGINLKSDINLYYFICLLFSLGFLFYWRVINSIFGQSVKATMENEDRAVSLGYNVFAIKYIIFIFSAMLAGLAGTMKTLVFNTATLSDASWQMSGTVVLMTLLGGMGTILGPIVGAAIVVLLEEKIGDLGSYLSKLTGIGYFESFGQTVSLITGIIFVLSVLAFRKGIVGVLQERFSRKKLAD